MRTAAKASRRRPKAYTLCLELLEDRELLSSSPVAAVVPSGAAASAFVGPVQAYPAPAVAPDASSYDNYDKYATTSYDASYKSSYDATANDAGRAAASDSAEYRTATPAQSAATVKDAATAAVKPPGPAAAPALPVTLVSRPLDATPTTVASQFVHGLTLSPEARPSAAEAPTAETTVPILALEKATEPNEELAGASSTSSTLAPPAPPQGDLLAGSLPVDLGNLRGAVDRFLGSLDDLAGRMNLTGNNIGLSQWLLAGATATGILEFVRRKTMPAPSPNEDAEDAVWAPYPVLAVLPPEE
ncbi:MAG TPA: hypothetical protein VGX76_14645 [Pirellulales bacterium]|jgi:hypothetical protein|nr:hypothetical protein [Pirellulales bacterium]